MNIVGCEQMEQNQIDRMSLDHSAVAAEEREFVAAAKSGDATAFGFLCTRYASMVFKVARRILPTKEDAEDAVQESFQLAFVHLSNFRGDSRFSTWLTRIVTNAALMQMRRNNLRRKLQLDESHETQSYSLRLEVRDQAFDPEQLCGQKECHRLLHKALNQLSAKTRRAIQLRELDERPAPEAARLMGISVNALKSRVFHGRKKLHRLLSRMKSKPFHRSRPLRMAPKPNAALRSEIPCIAAD